MTERKKRGRPSKWKDEYVKLAYNYALLGATDEDLAKYFDVTTTTIDTWKRDKSDFLGALKEGKQQADANVAKSLYRRAIGYSHVDTKFATHEGMITDEREYTKHYAPDPTAAIFWLKNRQRDKWRDKHEVQHSGGIEFNMDFGGDES